jgi:anti-sigma factor (TIGR02949 family)
MAEMDCNEAAALITALVDGELEVEDLGRIRAHLGRCDDCARREDMEARLKRFLNERLAQVSTPPDLKDRIRQTLAGLDEEPAPAGPAAAPPPPPRPRKPLRRAAPPPPRMKWWPLGVVLAVLVAMVAMLVSMEGGTGRPGGELLRVVTDIHYAATGAGIFQVRTHDRDELSRWLEERVGPFATVPDAAALGMTPAGGRVVEMGPHTMAMVLYRDYAGDAPDITLLAAGPDFTWPADVGTAEAMDGVPVHMSRLRDMGVAAFAEDGVTCILVSTREADGMRRLAAAFVAAMGKPAAPGAG